MQRVVLTGGPGSGKSSLIEYLRISGFSVADEAARRIIRERLNGGLTPRPSPQKFAREILRRDINNYNESPVTPCRFFDRGILDALFLMDAAVPFPEGEVDTWIASYPYHRRVFFLPPWKAIYANDAERDQTFQESVSVYEALLRWYLRCGYQVIEVPCDTVSNRCEYVLHTLGLHAS